MKLFLQILIISGIALIGLFFIYNNGYFNQQEITSDSIQGSEKESLGLAKVSEQGSEKESLGLAKVSKVKKIKVDLSQQKMFLFENGQFVKEYTISSGKIDTPTPRGNFRVIYKSPMVYSKLTDCWLPFWVGFTNDGKYGFHETPICEGKRIGESEVGQPSSAGCLRLKQSDSEEFYNWAEEETLVEIY